MALCFLFSTAGFTVTLQVRWPQKSLSWFPSSILKKFRFKTNSGEKWYNPPKRMQLFRKEQANHREIETSFFYSPGFCRRLFGHAEE
jgi:hypothetical protein